MRVSGFTMRRAERQLDQTLESQTQTSRRKIAIVGDGFGARAAAKEADDGVPGSQRAEPPEFEGSCEGRRAGKGEVRTSIVPYHASPQVQRFQREQTSW
jgi:hypothetical protein